MVDLWRLAQKLVARGEALSPHDCIVYAACLTLACYVVLLLSGRSRG